MRTFPAEIDPDRLVEALARHWGIGVDRLEYLPEGGGAYHWEAAAETGARWFVTYDDLDTKAWFGTEHESVFEQLKGAYATATALRAAGMAFVVAPLLTLSGDVALRLDPSHSLALFPFVGGTPGRWGEPLGSLQRAEVVKLLARLHSSPVAAAVSRRLPAIGGRERLERAIEALGRPWSGGPFSEPARRALAGRADEVEGHLAAFDVLAARLGGRGPQVVSHGEPHPGNLIQTADGLALVDWDTVALDRPERDLWMLDDGVGTALLDYERLTGRPLEPDAIRLYRLGWALSDLADFTALLRAPHDDDADTRKALGAVLGILSGDEPAPFGRPGAQP